MSYDNEEDLESSADLNTSEEADNSNNSTGEDTNPEQKNKSNWSKMSEAKKTLEKELKAERAEKSELKAELERLKDWANSLYGEDQEKPFTKKEQQVADDKVEKLEEKIFLVDNKEAKEYLDEIRAVKSKYNMDLDEAWTFVKAKLPPESKTKKDFDLSSKSPSIKKDLKEVSPEESVNLSKEDRSKWRKLHGWV